MAQIEISDDAFQPVHNRKKKRRGQKNVKNSPVSFASRVQTVEGEFKKAELADWMIENQKRIQRSLESIQWNPSQTDVLCLGLGSPMASKDSVAQLVWISSICDGLEINRGRASFFDPLFTEEDIRGLQEMGFQVSTENKGKYPLNVRTLTFMPHCTLRLYENLLRHNWSAKALSHLILLGNTLDNYVTVIPQLKLEKQAPCLSRICKFLNADVLPTLDQYPTAFNNTAVQYVELDSLSTDESFWTLPDSRIEESVDVEIV